MANALGILIPEPRRHKAPERLAIKQTVIIDASQSFSMTFRQLFLHNIWKQTTQYGWQLSQIFAFKRWKTLAAC